MKAYFEQLMDYNYWANGLVLKYAEQLPQDKFEQENAHSHIERARHFTACLIC